MLRDTRPCALLLQRLDGPPARPLLQLVNGLFDKAVDDTEPTSLGDPLD